MRVCRVSLSIAMLCGLAQWALAQQMIAEPPPVPRPANTKMRSGSTVTLPVQSDSAVPQPDAGRGWTPSSRLQIREDGGVRYVSGGIGSSEREELNALAAQFNLHLMFAMQAGNFVSDVQVKVSKQAGAQVLSAKAEGPLFFAQLPQGDYEVVADANNQTQHQTVRISAGKPARLNFFWR